MSHRHTITACVGSPDDCTSFSAGHNTHTVRATLAGADPRGWRPVVVEEIHGHGIALSYAEEPSGVEVWHHRLLGDVLQAGARVRLHPAQALLEVGTSWLAVAISDPD